MIQKLCLNFDLCYIDAGADNLTLCELLQYCFIKKGVIGICWNTDSINGKHDQCLSTVGHYGHYHGSAQRVCWTCTGGCAGNLNISTCLFYVIYII